MFNYRITVTLLVSFLVFPKVDLLAQKTNKLDTKSITSKNDFKENSTDLKTQNSNFSKFVGIEVGSKGVKMSLLNIPKLKGTEPYKIIKDTNVNTNFVNLDEAIFQPTLNAFSSFFNHALTKWKIPSEKIFTVISSGVGSQAKKEGKTAFVQRFIDSFKLRIKEPKRKVEVVDAATEARLVHLGVIPDQNRFNTFLIDIGSGNSKGVFFANNDIKQMKLFKVDWGTKNTTNAIEALTNGDTSIATFIRNVNYVINGPVNDQLTLGVNQANVFNQSETIGFNGGIPWSVATLIKPEFNDILIVKVTYKEVEQFYNRLINDKEFSKILPDAIYQSYKDFNLNKEFLKSETARVHEVFNRKSLIGGTKLLLKIMRQFTSIYEEKKFLLIKNTQAAWVSAYVNENSNK